MCYNTRSITNQEHTIETTEICLGIGAIDSSRPIINLPVFATSTTDFQMPTVPIQMLNSVCKDFGHLSDINFPQIRDVKTGSTFEFFSIPNFCIHITQCFYFKLQRIRKKERKNSKLTKKKNRKNAEIA